MLGFLTCEMGSTTPPPLEGHRVTFKREALCKLESTQHTGLLEKKGPGKLRESDQILVIPSCSPHAQCHLRAQSVLNKNAPWHALRLGKERGGDP